MGISPVITATPTASSPATPTTTAPATPTATSPVTPTASSPSIPTATAPATTTTPTTGETLDTMVRLQKVLNRFQVLCVISKMSIKHEMLRAVISNYDWLPIQAKGH